MGIERRPSHQLVVREASTRQTGWAAARQGLLPSPSAAVRPAIWGGSTSALATQKAVWDFEDSFRGAAACPSGHPGGLGLPPVHLGLIGLLDPLEWPSIRPTGSIERQPASLGTGCDTGRDP